MFKTIGIILISVFMFSSCVEKYDPSDTTQIRNNQVLLLEVDYVTNTFTGGTIVNSSNYNDLSCKVEVNTRQNPYIIKVSENSTGTQLFSGTMDTISVGNRTFPTAILDASTFTRIGSNDFLNPTSFNQIYSTYTPSNADVNKAWASIQSLFYVRQKLSGRNLLSVQYFLYTPSIVNFQANKAYWVFLLK